MLLTAVSLAPVACEPNGEREIRTEIRKVGVPLDGNSFSQLSVQYSSSDDLSGKAFILELANQSSEVLKIEKIVIDQQYSAPLANVLYFYGFWRGGAPFGRNFLRPGETAAFIFSHDISNHGVFERVDGGTLPNTSTPTELRVESDSGNGSWRFTEVQTTK
jgi:hypothetical protein